MAANNNYRFKTIMVTDELREEFSKFRDQLDGVRVTDKELSTLVWSLVDKELLLQQMLELKSQQERSKELTRIERLEQKLKEKLEKLETVRAAEKVA